MNPIGKKIEAARLDAGLNQSELARALKVTPQAVQKWESSGMSPKSSRIKDIANFFGTTVSYLVDDDKIATVPKASKKGLLVPLLSNAGSMGLGDTESESEDVLVGQITLSNEFVKKMRSINSANLRFIHAYGDSMSPTLKSGDILLVDTECQEIKVDGIYVLRAHGRLFVKRVRQRIDGKFEISSDNPNHKTVDVLNGESIVDILGRVVFYWSGNKVS